MEIPRKDSRGSGIQPFQLVTPQELIDKDINSNTNGPHGNGSGGVSQINDTQKQSAMMISNMTHDDSQMKKSKKGSVDIEMEDIGRRLFHPSLENTRDLENEIAILIQQLNKRQRIMTNNSSTTTATSTPDIVSDAKVIDVLNKSLMALSHWTLQGQLLQMSDIRRNDRVNNNKTSSNTPLMERQNNNVEGTPKARSTTVKMSVLSPPRQPHIEISPKTAVVQTNGPQKVIRFGRIRKPRQSKTIEIPKPALIVKNANSPINAAARSTTAAMYLTSPTNKTSSPSMSGNNNNNNNNHSIKITTTTHGVYKLSETECTPVTVSTPITTAVPKKKKRKTLTQETMTHTIEPKSKNELIRVFHVKK
ncbi:similar to Saccharomyces cerevisiae YDL129W Putative protein of unknown function [Maudiozyma barnettii]|uniref:Uncharacterized protein n=1 Tax=Maudiozyma barnettii TaxID=61262 RepID=A0A8H2VBI4_9SACH|nr:hypothetical protein [Kazachstania barnettii]CAB4252223.1 similar to Saccharomyces cerevisiae YDL129W Putative protein of unknown function [Kazachstania barnettii]CAD1778865.1 similar to Saccharomyces cerevisiae YDL129W Putative protein of unknown function [Kazachstania barnettii]